jgi:hypothetical protein
MDAVGFVLAFAAFLAGIYLLGVGLELIHIPTASLSPTSARISGINWLPSIFGVLQLGLGGTWIYAIFNKDKPWSVKVRKNCAMLMFLIYMFYGFSGVILEGITRVSWLSTFSIALIAGIKYLWLSTRDDGDGS